MTRRVMVLGAAAMAGMLGSVAPATTGVGPVVREREGRFELLLSDSMRGAIEARVPGFRQWTLRDYGKDVQELYRFTARQAPWAVVGDFNADGFQDVVVDGHTERRCYRLCAWGDPETARVEILSERECTPGRQPLGAVLMYVAPGEHGTNFSDDATFIFTDAFFDYIFEKAGSIVSWKNGEWRAFYAAD